MTSSDLDPSGRPRRGAEPNSRPVDGVARASPIATFEVASRRPDRRRRRRRRRSPRRRPAPVRRRATASAPSPRSTPAGRGRPADARAGGWASGSAATLTAGARQADGVTRPARRGNRRRTLPGKAGETVLIGWGDATERFGVAGADFVRGPLRAGPRGRRAAGRARGRPGLCARLDAPRPGHRAPSTTPSGACSACSTPSLSWPSSSRRSGSSTR